MLKISLHDFSRYRYPALKIHAGYIAIGHKAQLIEVNGTRRLSVFGSGSGIMNTACAVKVKNSLTDAWLKAASTFGVVVVEGHLEGTYHKAKLANHCPTAVWELLCNYQPARHLAKVKTSRLYLSEQYEKIARDNPDKLVVMWERVDSGAGAIWVFGKKAEMKLFASLSINGEMSSEPPIIKENGFTVYKAEVDKDIAFGSSNIIRFYDYEIVCGPYIRWETDINGYMLAHVNGNGLARSDQTFGYSLESGWYLFVRSLDFLKGGYYADGDCKMCV